MTSTTALTEQQHISQICLRLLARREHSQRELVDKLAVRGFSREQVLPVLAGMAEQRWQDDGRFAESYARQRMAKGYGPIRIQAELQQRGIDSLDLQALVSAEAGSWQALLAQLYSSKYDDDQPISLSEWQKRSRFLQQRGFSFDMIRQLAKTLVITRSG
jgi:regulatory protein